MSSLSELAGLVPGDAISAARSHSAILPPEMWAKLYEALELAPPRERIADFHLTLGANVGARLLPSYNTGVILSPRSSPLPAIWRRHLETLGGFREQWDAELRPLNMAVTDEPAFASAIAALRSTGAPFVELPDRFNGRWRHLYRRSPRMRDFAIFHMTSSFAQGSSLEAKVEPTSWGYQKKLLRRYGKRWLLHSESHARDAFRYLVPATVELLHLGPMFARLYERHIRSVVENAR
jgi:hypothetical protein